MTYHHGNLKQELLDRAAEVVAERGIEALSLRGLARDIGVSHAAPARHFKDKATLMSALAAEGHTRLTRAVTEAADAAGSDPVARYNAMGKAVIRFSLEHPAFFRTFTHPDVAQQGDEELEAVHKAYMETVKQAAADAQATGWHKGTDLMALLVFSSAAAMGTADMFTNTYRSDIFEGYDLDDIAEKVINLVVPPSSDLCELNDGEKS